MGNGAWDRRMGMAAWGVPLRRSSIGDATLGGSSMGRPDVVCRVRVRLLVGGQVAAILWVVGLNAGKSVQFLVRLFGRRGSGGAVAMNA